MTKRKSVNSVAAFKAALAHAAEEHPGDPQWGSRLAVEAAWDFVVAQPGWSAKGLDRPLVDLVKAIDDLRNGRTPAMLRAKPVSHRPKDSVGLRTVMGWASATIDQLRRCGMALEPACKAVALALKKHGVSMDSRTDATPAWVLVRRWRERASKLPADDPLSDARRALNGADEFRQLNQLAVLALLDSALRTLVDGPLD